jgi:predicted DCC family thiol-disulfide oxidoreductase YuxK
MTTLARPERRERTVPVVRFTVRGAEVGGSGGLQRSPTPDVAPGDRPYTVVFDGHCKVCGRLARILARLDRRHCFEIIPSQTPGVRARFPWIPASAYAESLQVVGPGGRTWQGAAAIERILDLLPRGRLLTWIFDIPFVRALADRFYRWFARNRYRLGCGEHCQFRPQRLDFPDGDATARGAV